MTSPRKNLRSQAHAAGGENARRAVQDLLAPVPDLAVTGYVKFKDFPHKTKTVRVETVFDAAAQLISALYERGQALNMWTASGIKGNKTAQQLYFTSDQDAVLAKLLINE